MDSIVKERNSSISDEQHKALLQEKIAEMVDVSMQKMLHTSYAKQIINSIDQLGVFNLLASKN